LIFFGVFAAGVLAGTMLHSSKQRPKRQEKQRVEGEVSDGGAT